MDDTGPDATTGRDADDASDDSAPGEATLDTTSDSSTDTVATTSDSSTDTVDTDTADTADTFGVGIHVTETELQFVVHVPSSIDSGWTDPEAFQGLVERVVWTHLEQEPTLRTIATSASTGETVTLGTVTLRPDGTVVDHTLSPPETAAVDEPPTDPPGDRSPGESHDG
jgi:hypothetical protein